MTLSIEIISDKNFIRNLLSRDDIYDEVAYDNSPPLEDYVPTGIWFLLAQNNHIAGLINVNSVSNVMWNCHVLLYREYRGKFKDSHQWAIMVANYMKKHFGATSFLAITPYEAAKKYAERAGFKYKTTLECSILKDGKLLDQYLLELK